MTNNQLTRERLQEIAEDGFLKHGESKELARIALAAMDSEPVTISHDTREFLIESINDSLAQDSPTELDYQFAADIEKLLQPLYRHAQPVRVVPDDYQRLRELYHAQEKRLFKIAQRIKGPAFDKYSHSPSQAIDVLEGAIFGENDACRAAMLQCAENTESRCGIQTAPALDFFKKKAESRCGNSPVIPEGYVMVPKEPTEEMQSAGASAIRIETTALNKLWTGNAVFRAMLAAAPQEVPDGK